MKPILRKILIETHPYCSYCEKRLSFSEATLDHKTPKANGGNNDAENLVLSCRKCNTTKGDIPDYLWQKLLPILRKVNYFEMTHRNRQIWRREYCGSKTNKNLHEVAKFVFKADKKC